MAVDAIIIGSGQAGVPLATRLSAAGWRVLLVERSELGGTCVNTGCTPTKTMIASARAAHVARTAERLGVRVPEVSVDLAAVVRRKDRLVQDWRDGIANRLASAGDPLTLLRGHARFAGERSIEVHGERHEADIVVINTGARPVVPPIDGLDSIPWLDNRRAMDLTSIPSHLLVVGGGYIGCELAQMFRRFGARVTIIDRAPRLLNNADEDASSAVEAVFRDEGIDLELEQSIKGVEPLGDDILMRLDGGPGGGPRDGRELRGSHLLVATGRRPNSDDLACDVAGIDLDSRGFIVIDDRFRTSASGVYAVGDVAGEPQFTHVSWDDHRILFDLLMMRSQRGRGGRIYPQVAFTDPQVAGVGLTEHEAKERGVSYEVASYPFSQIARAQEVGELAGLLKVIIDPSTEHILGATIVGAEAGELLHVFVALMQAGASARVIAEAMFVHPTFAEGVQSVVRKLDRFAPS